MSDLPKIFTEAINIKRRLAVAKTEDGDTLVGSIENFLDANGDETQDASIATIAIIKWQSGGWSDATIAEFDGDLS